jgi:radical SAM protein with 4Fe4S-binding SPASM domain
MRFGLTELTIELLQSCPNACLFCSSLATRDSSVALSVQEVLDVAAQAKELGLWQISLSGGEPLCHPDLARIISALSTLPLSVSLYTTGIRLEQNRAVAFTDWKKVLISDTKLIFNVQSTVPEVHDHLVGRLGALELTKQSLCSAISDGIHVEAHIIPTKINLGSIEKTVDDLSALGVKQISFLRLVPQGYARQHLYELRLTEGEANRLRLILASLKDNCQKARIRLGIPLSGFIGTRSECNAGHNKLIIRYDGKVLPCEAFKDCGEERFVLGDIRQERISGLLRRALTSDDLACLKRRAILGETCPAQVFYACSGSHLTP